MTGREVVPGLPWLPVSPDGSYSRGVPESHALRRERLRSAVAASGADAALITSLVNVRYLTGLASSNAALLVPADGPPVLATDSRYALAAERDCPGVELVNARAVEAALAELAVARGLGRLAFEAQEMTVERHVALATTEGLTLLVPLGQPPTAVPGRASCKYLWTDSRSRILATGYTGTDSNEDRTRGSFTDPARGARDARRAGDIEPAGTCRAGVSP